MAVHERWVESPIGRLRLVAEDGALMGVFMEEHTHAPTPAVSGEGEGEGPDPLLAEAARQLRGWFAGERTAFELPLAPRGTPFQREVWAALQEIPFGETRSYAEVAARLGRPRAVRAVGGANGRNPLSIVIPCHRVIGAAGALTGYGGGMERKRWLLDHERQVLGRQRELFDSTPCERRGAESPGLLSRSGADAWPRTLETTLEALPTSPTPVSRDQEATSEASPPAVPLPAPASTSPSPSPSCDRSPSCARAAG